MGQEAVRSGAPRQRCLRAQQQTSIFNFLARGLQWCRGELLKCRNEAAEEAEGVCGRMARCTDDLGTNAVTAGASIYTV